MSEYYSTPEDVISYTGIKPEDLGMDTESELKIFIVKRLIEIKDIIDHDRKRDYHAEAEESGTQVPPGIVHIALRIAKNFISHAVLSRETPIIRIDDFTIRSVEDKVMTRAITEDLKRFPLKKRIKFFRGGSL